MNLPSIDTYTKIESKIISLDDIIVTEKTGKWCQLPYPDHPKGCPNYGKNPLCPPNTKLLDKSSLQNTYKTWKLIFISFDIKKYYTDRKTYYQEQNIQKSDKQLLCCLYWQNAVKSLLSHNSDVYNADYLLGCGSGIRTKYATAVPSMESVGINVMMTLKKIGIEFEVKPKNKVILVCLAGYLSDKKQKQTALF